VSEMVERVAQAIFKAHYGYEMPTISRGWAYDCAHAAIAAMRAPTLAMKSAGANSRVKAFDVIGKDGTVFDYVEADYQAMIDEALK